MSSTLFVDAIEPNLSSGVHIPGHVVQVQSIIGNTFSSTTTAGVALTGATLSFTPKYANSNILISIRMPYTLVKGTATAAWFSPYIKVDGSAIGPSPSANYEYGINFGDTNWNDFRGVAYTQAIHTVTSINPISIASVAVNYGGDGTLRINEDGYYKTTIIAQEIAQ